MDLRAERDIEQLRRIALSQQVQIEQLLRVLRAQAAELAALKGNGQELQQTLALVEDLTKRAAQVAGDIEKLDEARGKKKEKKARETFGATEQPALPHVEQVYELDEADKACRACGGVLTPMKDQFESSEMVDVIEVSYRVVQVKQQKYACRCGACIETAPGPERATPGGRYSLDFAVKVAIDKYLDHIPLARQERILGRHGITVTSQTLWDQLEVLGRRLDKASRALMAKVLAEPVIGLDQTSWPRLEAKDSKPWQIWALTAPGIVVHRIRDDKGADTFKSIVGEYRGVIVCDALATHDAGARGNDAIALAGCWAHYPETAVIRPDRHFVLAFAPAMPLGSG